MRRRLRAGDERGVAMVVVMSMLMVLSVLAATVAATSARSTNDADRNRNSKRALAAAEAGIQVAAYRLKKIEPAADKCLTTAAVSPTGGECPSIAPESVGTDATYSYTVTQQGASCSTLPGYTPVATERCITAIGTVKGVVRRIQTRVQFGPNTPWAQAGVLGTEWVTLNSEVTIDDTDAASNLAITLNGTPKKVEIQGVARPYVNGGSVVRNGTTTITGGIVNSPYPYTLQQADFAPSRASNNNGALPVAYYTAATRAFSIPANTTYLMPAGTYNFCSWTMAPGAKVDMVSSSAVANVYLDSPRAPSSGCPAGSGKFSAIGNSVNEIKMNNGRFDANITVWVYGTTANATESPADIRFGNRAHIDAVWYAPDSIFHVFNNVTMHGGVAARKVLMENDVESKLDTAVASKPGPGTGPVLRKGWFECKRQPTVAGDPESGC